jgi:hypothetical protein
MGKARFVRVGFSLGLATLTAISNPLSRLSLIGIGATAISSITPAQAATLTNWQFDPNTRELWVTVPEGATPRYFVLAEPPRIVLDLPNTQVGGVPEQQTFDGVVRQIRVGQFQPGLTRIVVELTANAEFAPGQVELRQEGDRWVLRPLLTDGAATPDIATAPIQPAPIQPAPIQPPLPQVEAAEAETSEAIPEAALPESAAIAPPPAPLPDPTAAESRNDLPQLSPASPVAPNTSPDIPDADVSDVPSVVPEAAISETEPEITAGSDATANMPADLPSANLPSTNLPPSDLPSANLPPLEPGALEIPVEPTSALPEMLTPENTSEVDEAIASEDSTELDEAIASEDTSEFSESSESSEAIAPAPEVQPESQSTALESEVQPEAIAPTSQIPTALPPATFSASPSATVTVPPLSQAPNLPEINAPDNAPIAPTPQPSQPTALPPATFSPSQNGQVSVPPVSTIPDPTAAAPIAPPQPESAIESGQPISGQAAPPPVAQTAIAPPNDPPQNDLPPGSRPDQDTAVAPTSPNVLLPSGTVLSLRYPGETSLSLESGVPRQEVLLLDQPVRDRNGNLIAEAGSQVIGRFETGSQGSRFIAQAITLQGQNVLIEAESEMLAGDREVSENSLIQNSALGALALTVLDGFTGIGLLGGLAAGATATYLTAPQPATIQPNQIVEVRLTADLPRR